MPPSSKPNTAAIKASWAKKSPLPQQIKQEDVNSHGLGVAVKHPRTGKMINHLMIRRNTRLPAETKQTFHTNAPAQQRVTVKVIEGDAPDPEACTMIGNCSITNLPTNLPKGAPIEVTYAFDSSGRVVVRAKDVTGGQEATIEIHAKAAWMTSRLTPMRVWRRITSWNRLVTCRMQMARDRVALP